MAGKVNKKNPDNFEKLKREMTEKRQKAKIQKKSNIVQTEETNSLLPVISETSADQGEENKINIEFNVEILTEAKKGAADEVVNDSINENARISIKKEKKTEMIVFWIGEEEFSLAISNVKEIIRIPAMNQVPNAPSHIAGLCALRGQLMPVIDSRKLFGMPHKERSENSRVVIADINGKSVGLITDRVSEVISIEETMIKEPPSSIKGVDGGIIKGILLLNKGKRVIMILDAAKTINTGVLIDNLTKQNFLEDRVNDLSSDMLEEEQIIVFDVGEEEYAFSIDNVIEIIRFPDITKVPNTDDYIEGIFASRNQLLAVINMRTLINADYKKPDEHSRVIIIDNGELEYGVVVDRVSQVMRVEKSSFKKNSVAANSTRTDYIKGFYNLNNGQRLLIMLEAYKLISIENIRSIVSSDSRKSKKKSTKTLSEMNIEVEKMVVFKLDEQEYAIRINNVREINRITEIAHFPGAPGYIDGMVNLRGDIIPVLNLRTMFELQTTCCESSKYLVVEHRNRTIGIMIDSASEAIEVSKNSLEEVSEALVEDSKIRYIDSIVKLNKGKRIVLLLDIASLLSFL